MEFIVTHKKLKRFRNEMTNGIRKTFYFLSGQNKTLCWFSFEHFKIPINPIFILKIPDNHSNYIGLRTTKTTGTKL